MITLGFLKDVDLFKGLTADQIGLVQGCCHQVECEGKQKLNGEGDEASRIWVVAEGQVDLCFDLPGGASSELCVVSTVGPGESFGWSTFVPPYRYRLSSYAVPPGSKVIWIDKESLNRLFEDDKRMGYVFMSNLAGVINARYHQLQARAEIPFCSPVKITVHMATCGISAGAREVMKALTEELSTTDRRDIQVVSGRCIGKCPTEPNVTIEMAGAEPVIYGRMTPEKIRRVFRRHVLGGHVQAEDVLS
jgi:NADP-reducing hydrogenase subunit HndB